MWKTLKDLYQNNSDQRKLALKDKLRKIKCEKGDMISTYLNKLNTCRDELGSVGITTAMVTWRVLHSSVFLRAGIATKTRVMEEKNCQIGNDFGQI